MGSRFAQQPQYHNLIRAHGVIAAITFLAIVPAAILILRFYGRSPRWALRFHIWLQILTVLMTTVIFVLGWLAVGPSRRLTNPHHGIGLAIYVLVLFQFIVGWWVHRKEKLKRRLYEPLKVMVRVPNDINSYMLDLTDVVPPLDWSLNRSSRACTDTPWPYALRISSCLVRTICIGRLCASCRLFRLDACARETRRQRLRQSIQL